MRTDMLWYKAWLETRWRFVIGLVLLMLSAGTTVMSYPEVLRLMPLANNIDTTGELGRRIHEAAALARSYRGYLWSQWFSANFLQMWSSFAVLLGSGGLLAQSTGGGALYTLSLPATRARLVGTRAATALLELLVLAVVPSLLLALLSPAIGERYSVSDALVHAACMFVGGAVLFSLAFLLSTVFSDVWRPILIVLCAAAALAFFEQLLRDLPPIGLFRVMSGEAYFRNGGLPWLGLVTAAALSAALLTAANRNIARQDF
jgi:ABC-2 type transport system permease protein